VSSPKPNLPLRAGSLPISGGELADDVGGEDLAGLGASADAGGELDGGAPLGSR
jgi:hypothetical protein